MNIQHRRTKHINFPPLIKKARSFDWFASVQLHTLIHDPVVKPNRLISQGWTDLAEIMASP
jgi:hypothetical protein